MFPPCVDRFGQFRAIGSGIPEFMAPTRAAQCRSGALGTRRADPAYFDRSAHLVFTLLLTGACRFHGRSAIRIGML
jgi:hypothetical protein